MYQPDKINLFSVHLEEHVLIAASSFLGCYIGKLTFLFLGIQVGGSLFIDVRSYGILWLQS